MIEISVITLTFNRPDTLHRCLDSLSKQTLDPGRFELVLVDVSDEPVTSIVSEFDERLNISHLKAENLGVAGNRNVGAASATAPLLAFIDDDCIAHSDWLEKLLLASRAHPGALIGGAVANMNPDNAVSCAGQVITDAVDRRFNPPGEQATFFPGLNFLAPRERFLEIGGNDATFGRLAAEDREFADRWLASGFEMSKQSEAVVVHEHRKEFMGFVRQYFNYGKGAWRYHRERRERGDRAAGDTSRLHLGLRHYIRDSMRNYSLGMRAKIWFYLAVWEISNLLGFAWQAVLEATGRDRQAT